VVLVLALAVLAGTVVQPARADGDPASDVLPFDDVYLPLEPVTPALAQQLKDVVAAANKSGFKIKVALIATATDLGSVPSLFGMPGQYAKFLGAELLSIYKERLLIVMPAGFGLYRGGQPTDTELASVTGIKIGAGSDGLAQAAIDAVKRLDDRQPPVVKAQSGSAKRGTRATLRYLVSDDSGSAGVRVTLARGKKAVATLSSPVKPLHGAGGSLTWKVSAGTARGVLTYCVVGVDAAGNRSKPSCAPFRVL
jgi:hypothetical protein